MNTAKTLTLHECDQLAASAAQLQDRGDWLGAERVLRQVLNAFPAHAQGLHLAGILAHVSGQTELGLGLIDRAIESNPAAGLFYANAGEMARLLGRAQQAVKMGRRAVEIDPGNANAWSNLGIALYDSADFDEAEKCHMQAIALAPAHSGSLNNLGSIWHARGDADKAIAFYKAAIKANPAQVDSVSNLGTILMERHQYPEAAKHLEAALRINGAHLGALCNLARTYCEMGNTVAVPALLHAAVQQVPEALHVLWALVVYHQAIGEYELALTQVDRAIELYPQRWEFRPLRAKLMSQLDKVDEAIAELKMFVEQGQGTESDLVFLQAELLGLKGNGRAVIDLLEPLASKYGRNPVFLHHWVSAEKVLPGSAAWTHLSQINGEEQFALLHDKFAYHFAMAKAFDDFDRAEEAFVHYKAGCELKRSQFDYRIETDERVIQSLANLFTPKLISRLGGSGHPSAAPVFIVGMMRSGTSLMEQILASHPEVFGAGELLDFSAVTQEVVQRVEQMDTDSVGTWLDQVTPTHLQTWGAHYLDRVNKRTGPHQKFTDKLPLNFKLVGLIHLVFPNAKIIHMKRDPLDTCWSCYTQSFAGAHPYTFDLAELGRYYKAYLNLMAHWREVLPPGAMLEVQYEDLVNNQELVSRQVLDYCGLEWSDACLQFHKTPRSVRTASQYQVKQPMNRHSVLRSRKYEPMLGELLTALKS